MERQKNNELLEQVELFGLTAAIGAGGQAVADKTDWPSDGTCIRCGAIPRHPQTGLCNTCSDEDADFSDYDAGLLNNFGGGNVEWWQDYLRAEIGRANDFWRDQVSALSQPHPADERVVEARWREVETNHLLKGRRRSPAYFPATGEVCEVSGPNCDDANGYTWATTTVLWQSDIFVLYGQPGFWPVLHKHEHVLFRPLSATEGR
jgi:hypothetical protein